MKNTDQKDYIVQWYSALCKTLNSVVSTPETGQIVGFMLIILGPRRLRHEDPGFKGNLGYILDSVSTETTKINEDT